MTRIRHVKVRFVTAVIDDNRKEIELRPAGNVREQLADLLEEGYRLQGDQEPGEKHSRPAEMGQDRSTPSGHGRGGILPENA